jgi:hypothetical protein
LSCRSFSFFPHGWRFTEEIYGATQLAAEFARSPGGVERFERLERFELAGHFYIA